MLLKSITSIFCLVGLSACAYWPPEGHGGQAESFKTAPAYWSDLRQKNKRQIECFDRLIQAMSLSPIEKHHPATLASLSIDWTRAVRAHAGHMNIEAQHDLANLNQKFETFYHLLMQSEEKQHFISLEETQKQNDLPHKSSGGICT